MIEAPELITDYDPRYHHWPACVHAEQITSGIFKLISDKADELLTDLTNRDRLKLSGQVFDQIPLQSLRNTVVGGLILEQSTRTRTSFSVAAARLGATPLIDLVRMEDTSFGKGESWISAIKNLRQYHMDAFVLRTAVKEFAYQAAALFGDYTGEHHFGHNKRWSAFINAGNGFDQHPTQALLDMYAISRTFGTINGLRFIFAGDISRARTVNSLLIALAQVAKDTQVTIVAPKIDRIVLDPPPPVIQKLDETGLSYEILTVADRDEFVDLVKQADVGYWTRLQVERYKGELPNDFGIKNAEIVGLDDSLLQATGIKAFHPLPYREEVSGEIEDDPQAMFFKQAGWGVPVRMALLHYCITEPELLCSTYAKDTKMITN